MRPPPRRAIAVALASFALVAADARGDEKQACIDATDAAQQLRLDGKLTAARERLLVCARPECPAIVRQDCSQWLSEVVAALPTVVLAARDAQGHDLFDVNVSVDGAPVVERLDGKPFVIDPGRHVLRFERLTATAIDLEVLVRVGEKNREITATFPTAPAPMSTTPAPIGGDPHGRPSGGPSPLVWLLGGTAVAALGTSLAFLIAQDVEYGHLASTCGGHCAPDQVSPVSTERTIAAWTAVGGGVSLAAAACVFVLGRPASPPGGKGGTGAAVSVDVTPGPHGLLGAVVGRF